MTSGHAHVNPDSDPRYGAPALEKGLAILELLAHTPDGVTQKELAQRLGRSVSEIFRMLTVLERQAYVARDAVGAYRLTTKLFELAHRHEPIRRLASCAGPVLERFAEQSRQSNYIVVPEGRAIVVVAKADPQDRRVLSVRLGARFDVHAASTSAFVLAAFAPPDDVERLLGSLTAEPETRATLDRIVREGSACVPARVIPGLTDLSAPVFDSLGRAIAALSVNYLPRRDSQPSLDEVRLQLLAATREISSALGWSAP